jgi:uncharacterized protein YeaO (DUF488 family)
MRKIEKIPKPPEVGDTRVISSFALFPISITKEDIIEIRWFEKVNIKQELTREWNKDRRCWEYFWKDIDFV